MSANRVLPDRRRDGAIPSSISTLRGARVEGIKHPAVALARGLRTQAGRAAAGLYTIHGRVLLQRALEAGQAVALVLYSPRFLVEPEGAALLATLRQTDIPHALISENVMRTVVERAYLPEVIALVERRVLTVSDLDVAAGDLYVLADGITNPSNLGMLVRTAYGAGATALLMTAGTVDPFTWQVSTGSTGAIFRLPLVVDVEPSHLAAFRAAGGRAVAAVADAPAEYSQVDLRGRFCLIVGNEAHGLTPAIAALADVSVRIPMTPQLDSLNVAVAAGVILFEARRQRLQAERS